MLDAAEKLLKQAIHARKEHRLTEAKRDLLEAVSLYRQIGTRLELVQALKALGQIERDLGQVDAAQPLYEEAVAKCREGCEPLYLAHTVRHLGDIYQDAGRADLAGPCYLEALTIYRCEEKTQDLDLANAIRPLAILKENAGDVSAAKVLWEEARKLYSSVGISEGVAECASRIEKLAKR
jgi:tetratricopeptide (TPR) repeat protein